MAKNTGLAVVEADTEKEEERARLADNEFVLLGKVHMTKPLRGIAARQMLPDLVLLVSQVSNAFNEGELDLSVFGDEDQGKEADILGIFQLVSKIASYFKENMEDIENKWVPYLLGIDESTLEKLREDGEPQEVYIALFRAGRWLFQHHVTGEAMDALRYRPNSKN